MAVIARRYAKAFINIAIENNKIVEYEEQLGLLLKVVSEKQIKDILEYPGLNISKKKELIKRILTDESEKDKNIIKIFMHLIDYFKHKELKQIDKSLVNFFLLVLDHGRQKYFAEIVAEYKTLADIYKNILNIEIISANELEEEYIEKIKQKIGQKYGSKNVSAKVIISPNIIGGLKVKIGDTVIDGTIKSTLDDITKLVIQNNLI